MPFFSAAKAAATPFALILSLGLAGAAAAQLPPPPPAAIWSETSMPWSTMPTGDPVGPLPASVRIAPAAYAYSARSERIDFFGKNQPAIIRLTVQIQQGSVGILLVSPDGSTQLSKEAALPAAPTDVEVYFRVRPATPPSLIVMRNYNAPGQAGLVQLKSVEFIREGDLSNEELSSIVKKGLY
jgi:hypothetical protein